MSLIAGKEEYGMFCFDSYGPAFGGGHDLYIVNNANTSATGSNLGHTYQCPPGQQSTFFTGARSFIVTDYEVFGL